MKKNSLYLKYAFLGFLMILMGCETDYEDAVDFSETSLPYVDFPEKGAINLTEGGETVNVRVESPPATYQDIIVGYEITGAFTASGTVTIPSGELDALIPVSAPDNKVLDGGGEAILTLTSVSDGYLLGQRKDENSPLAGSSFISRPIKLVEDIKEVSFAIDSTGGSEIMRQVIVPVALTNPAASMVTVNYSVTGGTEGVHYNDPGAGSLVIEKGVAGDTIVLGIMDNLEINEPRTLVVSIDDIVVEDPDDQETFLNEEKREFRYTIVDDLRFVSFVSEDTVSLQSADIVNIEVQVSEKVVAPVTVKYTITGGVPSIDYRDLSGGEITFYPGGSVSKEISVSVLSNAFISGNKFLKVELDELVSDGEEVLFEENEEGERQKVTKVISIKSK